MEPPIKPFFAEYRLVVQTSSRGTTDVEDYFLSWSKALYALGNHTGFEYGQSQTEPFDGWLEYRLVELPTGNIIQDWKRVPEEE